VLKGKFARSSTGVLFRKGLVSTQFAVSILLIIGSFVVYRQLRFMTRQSLGYNMDQMMILRKPVLSKPGPAFNSNAYGFVNAVQQLAYVKGAAASGRIPGEELDKVNGVNRTDIAMSSQATMANMGVILIACLGLSGLSLLTTIQRTKEMGIRKVLGASVTDIILLLSEEFIKLVLLAIVIASPVAWYVMHLWLKDFAYRVDISWWIFALADLLSLMIALLVVGLQTVRSAIANPINSLRIELK